MTAATALLCLLAAGGLPSLDAARAFNDGELFLREIGMEPVEDFRRDPGTGIPRYSEGCESSRALDHELYRWNSTMLRLWARVNTADTNFTLRAGEEYLIYDSFLLFYTWPEGRTQIPIHPEELWAILSHLGRNPSAATSQMSVEGFYPGLPEPASAFITVYDPVYPTVEELLERGRETIPAE